MSKERHDTGDGAFALPLMVMCIVYVGLLAGNQALPGLGDDVLRFPQLRHLALLAAFSLLPGLLFIAQSRSLAVATRYMMALALFFAYSALTSMWSPVGAAPGDLLAELTMMLAYTFVVVVCATRMNDAAWQWFWWAVLAGSLIFGLGGLAGGGIGEGRMAAFGTGPNVFVRIVGSGAIVGAFLAYRSGRLVWLAPTALLTAVAVLSGSRGGMVALAIALMVSLVIGYRWLAQRRRVVAFGSGVVMVGIGLYATLGEAIERIILARFGEQLIEKGQTAGRDQLYEAGLELWWDSLLFGNGIGAFAVEYGHGYSYTHNMVLDVLVDGGLLGLALLTLALLAAGPRIWHTREGHNAALAATLALFYLVASQFSGTYYDTRFIWFFLGIAAVASAPRLNSGSDTKDRTAALPAP